MPIKMTTEQFITKSVLVHGDEYDYSDSIYTGSKSQINILHKKCGLIFSCKPNNHLMGSRCSHCYQKIKSNKEEFVRKSIVIHGDVFDYSEVDYITNKKMVKIKCKKCDYIVTRKPNSHLSGNGCPYCLGNAVLTKEIYQKKAKEKHGDKYDYSMANDYSKVKIKIKCNSCGLIFMQNKTNHLSGNGCPCCKCDKSGYTRTNFKMACEKNQGKGSLYLLKMIEDDGKVFYKIGITSNPIHRRHRVGATPYKYEVLSIVISDAILVWETERKLKRSMRNKAYSPKIFFQGCRYECFDELDDLAKETFGLR